jgi:hypothetical protein
MDECWLKAPRKRHRNSSEVAAAEPALPKSDPKITDSGKKDSKRMREYQSPRTLAQKLAEGDELVPQPGFISAAEKAERDARKTRERDARKRVNFGGSSQVDEEMETGGVQ